MKRNNFMIPEHYKDIFSSPDNIVIVPSYFLEKNLTERYIVSNSTDAVLKPCFISYQDLCKNLYVFQRFLDVDIELEFEDNSSPFFKKFRLLSAAFQDGASVKYVQSIIEDLKLAKKSGANTKMIDAVNSYLGIDANINAIAYLSENLHDIKSREKIFLFHPISREPIETAIASNKYMQSNMRVVGDSFDMLDGKASISVINHRVFELTKQIEVSEALNDIEEARIISLQIQEMLYQENSTVSVITNSYSLRRKIFLELESVGISSSYRVKLVDTPEFQLMMCIVQLVRDPNDYHALLSIIFSKLFTANYEALGLDIYKQGLYVDEKEYLFNVIRNNDCLREFYNNILSAHKDAKFGDLVKRLHQMFFQYCDMSNMSWQMKNKLICFCDDLLSAAGAEVIYIKNQDIVSWLKFLASSEEVAAHLNPIVKFYSLEDVDYMHLDRVILSDTDMMKAEKDGDCKNDINIAWYRYLNVLQSADVKITRSYKLGSIVSEKSLLYKLLEQQNKIALTKKYSDILRDLSAIECIAAVQPQPAYTIAEPKYSVSAIEVLMRDPYSYYAKYVLKLRKQDRFFDDVWARDFGILAHDVMSKLDLSKQLDDNIALCETQVSDILCNQNAIMRSYINERLRDFVTYVYNLFAAKSYESYAEIKGAAFLTLDNNIIVNIHSRADRILLDDEYVEIVDFKTGALPSEKQVNEGAFPQLAIEKWILENDGFAINYVGKDVKSSFVQLKGISKNDKKFIKCDSEKAEISLKELLTMFVKVDAQYFATHNEYDVKVADYMHLRRFQEWFDAE